MNEREWKSLTELARLKAEDTTIAPEYRGRPLRCLSVLIAARDRKIPLDKAFTLYTPEGDRVIPTGGN